MALSFRLKQATDEVSSARLIEPELFFKYSEKWPDNRILTHHPENSP